MAFCVVQSTSRTPAAATAVSSSSQTVDHINNNSISRSASEKGTISIFFLLSLFFSTEKI